MFCLYVISAWIETAVASESAPGSGKERHSGVPVTQIAQNEEG
jgi:hypothetical protein